MTFIYNPFLEYSIVDYSQFKEFPFLESKSIAQIKNKFISLIRSNFKFPERLLLIGDPGIGKTSSLFYIRDLLKAGIDGGGKCNVFLFSKFFTDADEFKMSTGEELREVVKHPTFILVDFPDTINPTNFKNFLNYLWSLLTHKDAKNINLIFALNVSHYSHSLTYSEILNKFDRFRLERMDEEETAQLIEARLNMVKMPKFFQPEVYNIIFQYTKGIPRNIICASKNLVEQFFHNENISGVQAKQVLKEEYVGHIINDRIEDLGKRELYKQVVDMIDTEFKGEVRTQEEIINRLKDKAGIGRNRAIRIISDLSKFGIVGLARGGRNNVNKIISLT